MKKQLHIYHNEVEKSDSKSSSAGKILMATKGDVHDIGKNIVSVVLGVLILKSLT